MAHDSIRVGGSAGIIGRTPQNNSCGFKTLVVVVTMIALAAIVYGSFALHDPKISLEALDPWGNIGLIIGGSLAIIAEGVLYCRMQKGAIQKGVNQGQDRIAEAASPREQPTAEPSPTDIPATKPEMESLHQPNAVIPKIDSVTSAPEEAHAQTLITDAESVTQTLSPSKLTLAPVRTIHGYKIHTLTAEEVTSVHTCLASQPKRQQGEYAVIFKLQGTNFVKVITQSRNSSWDADEDEFHPSKEHPNQYAKYYKLSKVGNMLQLKETLEEWATSWLALTKDNLLVQLRVTSSPQS